MLLDALIDEARRRRATEMLLEVRADNQPALALYQRHGFERIARRRGYFGAGRIDGLVLRRWLRRT
jgi:ribosomal-protein-alanine N-acetyltransferase